MISFWVHSLLPLLLFLFNIRLLPEEHEDAEVFSTDAILLTANCSWFYTILLEFSSMFLCRISFLLLQTRPLFSVPKKIDANGRISQWEMFRKIGVLFWSFVKKQKSGTSSDNGWYNEWQRMTTSDNKWYIKWQRMKMSDKEWQRMAMSDSKWEQWYSKWKRHSKLQRMDDCNHFNDKKRYTTTSRDGWLQLEWLNK